PNYVLTAAHNLYVKGDLGRFQNQIRVTSSNQQKNLNDRQLNPIFMDPNVNVDETTGLFLPFDAKFRDAPANSTEESKFDIGLIELNNTGLISDAPPVGLTAFVVPRTVRQEQIPIQTAGYPVDNVANTFPDDTQDNDGIPDRKGNIRTTAELNNQGLGDFSVRARDLVLAPGILDEDGNETTGTVFATPSGRRIEYSNNIDTVGGQSGSPVWHTLEGDEPRVLGVHSRGPKVGRNVGTLIDIEAYKLIIDKIEGNGDPNLLPENLIYGSDPLPPPGSPPNSGNDRIVGTYRKERILGLAGNDTIEGAGADDRLEGNEGNDNLDGGAGDDLLTGGAGNDIIDGGTNPLAIINPFNRENDVAVYSANISDYNIEFDTSDGLFGSPIGEETVAVVTHLNGGIDGEDTLTNVEFLQFADTIIPLASDDDDVLNFIGTSGDDDIVG
ncbi:MAG: hypothetical protein AAGK97_14480, partial [Bacteroidota bacterium]